ncbi:MAG: PSD1 and planctomycete cytochrome C domain-containing protein [Armatimonadota bacterium]
MRSSATPFLTAAAFCTLIVVPVLAAGARPAVRQPQRPAPAKGSPAVHRGYQVVARSCFKCHGESSRLSGLDLRTLALAKKGGEHGAAVVPGSAAKSRLYRMLTGEVKPQMPPTGALSPADQKAVREWIEAGAPYPASARAGGDGKWWAFRPVVRPRVPAVEDPWVRNPVDAFVLAKLRAAGLRPNPEADRRTLIRRATLDLHGLPPTPDEVEAFVSDRSPDAYEKLIDRLLASPRYGERWGRTWLDLARYAESEGFKADETRPNAWRYRDYVIEAFNQDKPYNRFIREQIAGDECYPNDPSALVATGFNRHWADESNARNLRLRRQEILNDITDTVGSVVLGLTVGCARCHDHKYDAITQKDYYQLQAFFAALQPRNDIPLVPAEQLERYRRELARWEAETRPVREKLAALEAPYREKLLRDKRMPFTEEVQEAIDTPAAKRTALQWQLFLKVAPQIELKDEDVGTAMKGEPKEQWTAMRKELERFDPLRPQELPLGLGVTDVGPVAPKTHVLAAGGYDSPQEEVRPGFITAIDPRTPQITPPAGVESTGRRTALAAWLTSPENPLTARVLVNRVWQGHFGQGIVPTSSDFGKSGELPSHPELLDYLAWTFSSPAREGETERQRDGESRDRTAGGRNRFVPLSLRPSVAKGPSVAPSSPQGLGWSLKRLHRLVMTSSAYRQSSAFNPTAAARDPENRLLWRHRRQRLEAEMIRDTSLAVSGLLNPKMGGPSIFPELPEGVSTRGGWPVTKDPAERNRRSVYVFVRRNTRYPLFEAFDFPDTHEPCARRSVTNTAPQALMLFNSELGLQWAQAFAGRVLREAESPEARVERAYRLAFGRAPEAEEARLTLQFLREQAELVSGRLAAKEKVALPEGGAHGIAEAEGAAWVDLCHALLNSNEFLYVD